MAETKEIDGKTFNEELMEFIQDKLGGNPALVSYSIVTTPGDEKEPARFSSGCITILPNENPVAVLTVLIGNSMRSLSTKIDQQMGVKVEK